MRKLLDAIPANAIITISAILLIASPLLVKVLHPFLQTLVPIFLMLVTSFFMLLLAATPFLIAVLVWRVKRWRQSKSGTPLTPLPPV
jgi:hypothetical protein